MRLEPRVLQVACVPLAALLLVELSALERKGATSGAEDMLVGSAIPAAGGADDAGPVASPSELPAEYRLIEESGIFGNLKREEPKPPALIGILGGREGTYAILRGGDGKTFQLAEGEEANGVTLLRTGTNRVLVRHLGKDVELTLFSGLGGASLVAPGDEDPGDPGAKERATGEGDTR